EFISLRQLFPQTFYLFSESDQFFFQCHASTLPGLNPFGKSPADLGCYFHFASLLLCQTSLHPFERSVMFVTIVQKSAYSRLKEYYK
ncbi:MAG TPA: hypothetical protein VNG51_16535, partial [Ktedonobacteraceae bacterium]|nr:hypothetical protein [Ktedonobacteraceae bacterium]